MKAYAVTKFGPPEHFEEIELPDPVPAKGEVLIRVAATSVNPVDTKLRAGMRSAVCPDAPAVLHMDVAGTVETVGEGVGGIDVGDEVYGCAGGLKSANGKTLGGALAELMVADANLVALKPKTLTLEEAAAMPLVTITAWESLYERARITGGACVLVHAGVGGVGHVALQLAKAVGARVYTTVSTDAKATIARGMGADGTIDYRRQSVAEYVEEHTGGTGFDVVLDTVGGECLDRSLEAAAVNGTVVTILAAGNHDLTAAHQKGLSLHVVFMLIPMIHGRGRARHGQILRDAARLVDEGRLRPLIDSQTFPFADAAGAHRRLESGEAVGKIVLTL